MRIEHDSEMDDGKQGIRSFMDDYRDLHGPHGRGGFHGVPQLQSRKKTHEIDLERKGGDSYQVV